MQVGRNDPCPCGSGKKYKKCCMLKEQVKPASQRLKNVKVLKNSSNLGGLFQNASIQEKIVKSSKEQRKKELDQNSEATKKKDFSNEKEDEKS